MKDLENRVDDSERASGALSSTAGEDAQWKAQWKADWIAALRSGKYKQGFGAFHKDGRFCCLGVLCAVTGQPAASQHGYGSNWSGVGKFLLPSDQTKLYRMNDQGVSFETLADYIEANIQERTDA